jgi:hypothetical protein
VVVLRVSAYSFVRVTVTNYQLPKIGWLKLQEFIGAQSEV